MRALTIIVILFALMGCDRPRSESPYELVSDSGGKLYRLDKRSGEVASVTPKSIEVLPEPRRKLIVGHYYQTEEGELLKYKGQGKFEPGVKYLGFESPDDEGQNQGMSSP